MDALTSPAGSVAVAIAALLVVLGFRLARPERAREWLAVAAYAAALAVQAFGALGLLPGAVHEPELALRGVGAALLVVGLVVAGGPTRARRRGATSTSTPTYAGLALVAIGQLLRGPSAAGAIATVVAVLASGWAALAAGKRGGS
jgi:hypothetical protein